jgi:lipopolysaccharide export system protein LptC
MSNKEHDDLSIYSSNNNLKINESESKSVGNGPRSQRLIWHSLFVLRMKVILPVVALFLVLLIFAWPLLQSEDLRFRLNFAALSANQNEDPSMINPRFLGIDKENLAYSITADLARNLTFGTPSVELEMPKADIALNDGTWLVLTAKNGVFQEANNILDLKGSVNLFHDSGYEFQTKNAEINLKQGLASGTEAVRGQGPFGELEGQGFNLLDKGKVIIFTGKSKLMIYPGIQRLKK